MYVFVRDGTGSWSQEAYIKASNNDPGDNFGVSVDLSGNTMVVGAPGEDSSAVGINGDQANDSAQTAGAVYVFTRDWAGTWSQQAYVKASNTEAGDSFHRVSLSGNTLAVGASGEDSIAAGVGGDEANNDVQDSGAVYVFVRDSSDEWTQQAYLKASNPDQWDWFGQVIALFGNTLAVGARGEDSPSIGINGDQSGNTSSASGAVYLFGRDWDGVWRQLAYLKSSNSDLADMFGSSVALSGDTLAVGAGTEDGAATGVNGDEANNEAVNSGAVYIFR